MKNEIKIKEKVNKYKTKQFNLENKFNEYKHVDRQ